MSEQRVGIIRAALRYLRFWNWRKARYILEAADHQFTGSVDGIGAAFDMQRDALVERFQGLRDSIAQVESVLEEKRHRLKELNEEEEELLRKREGALILAEEARASGDSEAFSKHSAAFDRFQRRIDEIEETQERLKVDVEETSRTVSPYMRQLQEMQAEIENLPRQKAEAIADFVTAQQVIELQERGLETAVDKGPISAVLEANRRLSAKARAAEKLAQADVRLLDKKYERAGRVSTARNKMETMLAARRAEKEGKRTEAPEEEKATDDDGPPEI